MFKDYGAKGTRGKWRKEIPACVLMTIDDLGYLPSQLTLKQALHFSRDLLKKIEEDSPDNCYLQTVKIEEPHMLEVYESKLLGFLSKFE
ncbi:hypothetical protein [Bacillus safensis]|uniref:Uncharacterized protein n=1 Tax=Bacillus safensis TaxID=561879 RepID=A0A1L6ZJB5_BACIA|nr:hypothetical protein [Bacillus safensis]APT46611.1 hypothetical protein BSA145_12600 [Bacillus safensis]